MTTVFIIKFDPDRIKTVGEVAFCNFQPHMVLSKEKKIQSAIKFFNFGRSPKTVTA